MDENSDKFRHKSCDGNVRRYDAELWEAAIYCPGFGMVYGAAKTPEAAIEDVKKTFDNMDWKSKMWKRKKR